MKASHFFSSGFYFAVLFVLTACDRPKDPVYPMESTLLTRFYEAIKAQDFAAAARLTTKDRSPEEWVAELEVQNKEWGNLLAYRSVAHPQVHTVLSGTRYTYKYRVQYAKHVMSETFVLNEDVNTGVLGIVTRQTEVSKLPFTPPPPTTPAP